MADLNKESMAIWKSLKPMIDEEIKAQTRGSVQRRKMKVTTAPSLVTNVIGVTEPYGTEMLIPFNTNLSTANVGDVVWVEFMYGATNAFASMYASADTKDWTVGGTLDVTGNTTLGGDLSVAGDESVTGDLTVSGDTTLNGVLDVTQRRCYANLSSAGWYRVMQTKDVSGTIIDFRIGRPYYANPAEAHKISFHIVGGGKSAFFDETSDTNTLCVDKIRATYGGGLIYFDVHYNSSSLNTVFVYFDVYGYGQANGTSIAMGLASVADAPSGETVLTTYNFAANKARGRYLIYTGTAQSGTVPMTDNIYNYDLLVLTCMTNVDTYVFTLSPNQFIGNNWICSASAGPINTGYTYNSSLSIAPANSGASLSLSVAYNNVNWQLHLHRVEGIIL